MKHKGKAKKSFTMTKTHIIFMLVFIGFFIATSGALYLQRAWCRHQATLETEMLRTAQSVEALLHSEHIESLDLGSPNDSDRHLVERSLIQLAETSKSIEYAYILKYNNGEIVVVADSSENNESLQVRVVGENLDKANRLIFQTGKSTVTEPYIDSSGRWIRVLTPVYDESKENIIAVLGLNYSATEWQKYLWKQMTPDFIIVACYLVLVILMLNLMSKHCKLKRTADNLIVKEALYRSIFEYAPIGISVHGKKKSLVGAEYYSINPMGEAILGVPFEKLKDFDWRNITHEDDLATELPLYERFAKGEIQSYSLEKRLFKPDGTMTWVNIKIADIIGNSMFESMYICLMEDISERKQWEESLKESERSKSVFFAHLPGMAYRCKMDADWTIEFVSKGCYELTGYTVENLVGNRDVVYNQIIAPEWRDTMRAERERVLLRHKHYHQEYEIITKSGERKWVIAKGRGIYDSEGNVEALEGIVLDISEQKNKERQIAYLQEHDFLTGLYNRNRMDKEKSHLDKKEFLPLSIAVCDIDGLRMINDAYSYDEGDQLIVKTANLIKGCLRSEHILSHEGGGKFLLLMPNTDSRGAHQLKTDIRCAIESYNRANTNALYTISVSIGHSTKENEQQDLAEAYQEATEYLKSSKLLTQNSSHSSIVSAIMATLYAKSQETERHGQRLEHFCRLLGEKLELSQKDIDELQLLSKLHDIGKIGIDDRILNKPSKLTEKEWKIMKQHPEIGHRIAMATPQLEHIAKYILHHHERWDGKGYPMGLKGEEIPIASRILAIADAFDAMTEDRIYRKALTREAAVAEIERNAGTQFDPQITQLFLQLILDTSESDE